MTLEESFQEVVYTGVGFLRALTSHYGPDQGYQVWDAMAGAVGEEVRGGILMHMLSVNSIGRRVSFRSTNSSQAVAVIKAIRLATGYGLKDAKDCYDNAKHKMVSVECTGNKEAMTLMAELRNANCEVL